MKCPRCQNRMAFDATIGKMRCTACGFRLFEDSLESPSSESPSSAPARAPKNKPASADAASGLLHIDLSAGMDFSRIPPEQEEYTRIRIRSRCEEAELCIARGDYAAARRALRGALDLNEQFAEPWFFLAALAETPADQRNFLEHAVACDPTNMRAVEYLTRLNYKAKEKKKAAPPLKGVRPIAARSTEPDEASTVLLICPECNGQLDYRVGEKSVRCKFCGTLIVDADDLMRTTNPTPIIEEILRSKHEPRIWNIGKRWMRCPNCGATTTLSRQTLSNTCRFCGSQQVIQESVNHQFEEPSLILPLTVDEAEARAAIELKLRSGLRAFTRFFADTINKVELYAVYLPFWLFDADMNVKWAWSGAPDKGEHPVILDNVPYFAGSNLSRAMLTALEPFDLSESVDYDPRFLAPIPALLYDMTAIQASIEVREKLSRAATDNARQAVYMHRPTRSYEKDSDPGELSLFAMSKFISYRLALLPVWLARLTEEDGDTRPVIINGQTAKVVLGKVVKQ